MSTQLATIEGRYEGSHNGGLTVNYAPKELSITKFAGGRDNGAMIQLTLENEYIQLTKAQVMHLISILDIAYKDDINDTLPPQGTTDPFDGRD